MNMKKLPSSLIVFILLLILPYLWAWFMGGQDYVFGGFLLNPMDGNSYLAKMYEGWRGDWAFTLPFTAQQGSGTLIFMGYLFLGKLARLTGISLILVFHAARIIGAVCLFFELRYFIHLLLPNAENLGRLAFILVLFGSGLGWIAVLFGVITSDLWVAEAYPFLSSFSNPHFTFGMVLLIRIFRGFISPAEKHRRISAAFFGALLSIVMPFGMVILATIGGVWWLVTWKKLHLNEWRVVFSACIPGGLLLIYQFAAVQMDPILSQWNAQNLTLSPSLPDFLISFSPALLFTLWGSWRWIRQKSASSLGLILILSWAAAGLGLVYFPFTLQRRFLFALFIPFVILAAEGLETLRVKNDLARRQVWNGMLIISFMTNAVVVSLAIFGILSHHPTLFLSRDEAAGLDYIQKSTPDNAIILCAPEMGTFVPAWTGRRVIYGHEYETIDAQKNQELVKSIYSGSIQSNEVLEILKDKNVQYIFWGPREKNLGVAIPNLHLKPVYQNATVEIFSR